MNDNNSTHDRIQILLDRGAFFYPCNRQTKARICAKGAGWNEATLDTVQAIRQAFKQGKTVGLLPQSLSNLAGLDCDSLSGPDLSAFKTEYQAHIVAITNSTTAGRYHIYVRPGDPTGFKGNGKWSYRGKDAGETRYWNGYLAFPNANELASFADQYADRIVSHTALSVTQLEALGIETKPFHDVKIDQIAKILATQRPGMRHDVAKKATASLAGSGYEFDEIYDGLSDAWNQAKPNADAELRDLITSAINSYGGRRRTNRGDSDGNHRARDENATIDRLLASKRLAIFDGRVQLETDGVWSGNTKAEESISDLAHQLEIDSLATRGIVNTVRSRLLRQASDTQAIKDASIVGRIGVRTSEGVQCVEYDGQGNFESGDPRRQDHIHVDALAFARHPLTASVLDDLAGAKQESYPIKELFTGDPGSLDDPTGCWGWDTDTWDYLLAIYGRALFGLNPQRIPVIAAPSGAGKGTLTDCIERIGGSYAYKLQPVSMGSKFGKSFLLGKRLIFFNERMTPGRVTELNEIIGNESELGVEVKHGATPVSLNFTGTITLTHTELPPVADASQGSGRRMDFFPTDHAPRRDNQEGAMAHDDGSIKRKQIEASVIPLFVDMLIAMANVDLSMIPPAITDNTNRALLKLNPMHDFIESVYVPMEPFRKKCQDVAKDYMDYQARKWRLRPEEREKLYNALVAFKHRGFSIVGNNKRNDWIVTRS